jgi:hypothetical protein
VTGIFKANNPSGNAMLFVYAIIVKLPMFLTTKAPQLQMLDGVLYKSFLSFLQPVAKGMPSVYSILTFILLFIQAIGLNKIANDLRLYKQNNYLTGMAYLLITSLFSEWFSLSAPLIVNTFIIWIWGKLCTLYNNNHPQASIFNIGLATGLAAFIYFPSITFLLLTIIGIAIARPFKLQEWLLGLAGIMTPVYFFAAYLFLTNKMSSFHFPGFHLSYPRFFSNWWVYAALAILLLSIIVGLYFINSQMRRLVVQTRKSWQLLFLYLVVAAVVPFVNAGINFSYWILLAVPVAPVVASTFFYPQKKLVPQLFHWGMVVIYVAIGFFNK